MSSLLPGARPLDDTTEFVVWAPRAERVELVLPEGEHERRVPMDMGTRGYFSTRSAAPAGTRYAFSVDGKDPRPDPASRFQPEGVHGPSVVVDPSGFSWTDQSWRGVAISEYVIYELHVGTFTDVGTFDAAIERLGYLRELGVTAIELMPVAQFPGSRNWGYDGVLPYAVQHSYGGPEGLRRLVNAAHDHGLAVVMDVVYNHIGPEGNYLDEYGPYFTDKYTTPWGRALNYDGAGSDEVRRFFIENARYWIRDCHIDGLRLDAVHGIFDFSAVHLLEEIGDAAREEGRRAGRTVVVIAESDLNDPRMVRARDAHGLGMDAQWADDFHHAVHSALTGETKGYYADFAERADLARVLSDPFIYAGRYSTHRQRKHGASAAGISSDHFVVAIQNHDQVGNRATGDRLSILASPALVRAAAVLLLTTPYVPLLFMGEEYGETNPFLYFVSHGDKQLVEAVRKGRRDEFKSFDWKGKVPDPQAEDTFNRSKLDWLKADRPEHARILALYRDLLRLRRSEAALRPGHATARSWGGDAAPFVLELTPVREGRRLLIVANLDSTPSTGISLGDAELLLHSRDISYAGDESQDVPRRVARSQLVVLPPQTAAVFGDVSRTE